MVEVGTKVCHHPAEVRAELVRLRGLVMDLAARQGLVVLAAGSHPFSSWMEQEITPLERYMGVKEDLQDLAQALLIFGTHVHIGIEAANPVDAMNVARYFLPHVLALSPARLLDGGAAPGSVVPERRISLVPPHRHSPVAPWEEFEDVVNVLGANSIPDASKIWWDLGPAGPDPQFRICDVCAGGRGGVHGGDLPGHHRQLWKLRRDNLPALSVAFIEEQWRALRYGLDSKLIDFSKQKNSRPEPDPEMLTVSRRCLDELGSRRKWSTRSDLAENRRPCRSARAHRRQSGSGPADSRNEEG
jgi:carboxylate-amine ligase